VGLDPEIAAALARLEALEQPALSALTPDQARAGFRETVRLRRGPDYVPESVALVGDTALTGPAGPVAARVYEPAERIPATIVFFHGGGWVIGDLDTHDAQCRTLANATRARVAAIDYRLAPEAPFPAPLEDCIAGVRWAAARWPGERLAVAGDSAGGQLAAAAALAVRDAPGGPSLAAQLLVYPATDPTLAQPSVQSNGEGYFLTQEDMRWFTAHYLPEAAMHEDPAVNLIARTDLAGLPPAVVVVAEFDPLHDEGVAYAEHLRAAGVAVTLIEGPGMIHGFYGMGPVSRAAARLVAEANRAFAELLAA
jgi:acetyl esterase